MSDDRLRLIRDGKPFAKSERGWWRWTGCEKWEVWESLASNNESNPENGHFVWRRIDE